MFTLWCTVPMASYISLVDFFLVIWGIRWSLTKSNRIHFTTTTFLLCSDRSLGFVGDTTTFSTRYHKLAISRRFYNLNFHDTNLEAPSKKWLSCTLGMAITIMSLNKLQYSLTKSTRVSHLITLLTSMCWSLTHICFSDWCLDIFPTETLWHSIIEIFPLHTNVI